MTQNIILQSKMCLLLNMFLAGCDLLVFEPSRLVVEYGAKASANCSTTTRHNGMGWEASQGAVDMIKDVQLITWTVQSLTHWDIKPICYINPVNGEQLEKSLPVTIYS